MIKVIDSCASNTYCSCYLYMPIGGLEYTLNVFLHMFTSVVKLQRTGFTQLHFVTTISTIIKYCSLVFGCSTVVTVLGISRV